MTIFIFHYIISDILSCITEMFGIMYSLYNDMKMYNDDHIVHCTVFCTI